MLEVLHHGVFGGAAVAGAGADLFPGSVEDLVYFLLGDVVGGELRVGEDGFELADQVGGGDDSALPKSRRSSMVPASTMETYMMALRGEYCIAILVAPVSSVASWDSSSCQEE